MGKRKIPSSRLDRTRCRVCGGYVAQEQSYWRGSRLCEKHRLIAVKANTTGQHAAQYQREFPRLKAEQRKAGERRAPEEVRAEVERVTALERRVLQLEARAIWDAHFSLDFDQARERARARLEGVGLLRRSSAPSSGR